MSDSRSGKPGNDCYSRNERGWMEYGQRLRAAWLHPLLVALTRARIGADTITIFSGVFGLAFAPLWLADQRWPAIIALIMHVLLDGLDGPCARFQGKASPRGSFTDTFTDQIVVTAVAVAWMIERSTSWAIALGAIYIFLYTIVVAMAMVRNALAVPYSWLVRPRFFVFAALGLEAAGIAWVTAPTLFVCCILLATKVGSGFMRLRQQIPGPVE